MKTPTLREQAIETLLIKGMAEVRRHAHVSIDNRHYCKTCYCCACLDLLAANTAGGYDRYKREG